jgi:hypothetical protein
MDNLAERRLAGVGDRNVKADFRSADLHVTPSAQRDERGITIKVDVVLILDRE